MSAPESLGRQFVFHHASTTGRAYHTLEAWAPEQADTDWAKAAPHEREPLAGSFLDPGHRPLGSMTWDSGSGEIRGIYADREHRHQGIATSLYKHASTALDQRTVVPPAHSSYRTPEGDAWAKKVGGKRPRLRRPA